MEYLSIFLLAITMCSTLLYAPLLHTYIDSNESLISVVSQQNKIFRLGFVLGYGKMVLLRRNSRDQNWPTDAGSSIVSRGYGIHTFYRSLTYFATCTFVLIFLAAVLMTQCVNKINDSPSESLFWSSKILLEYVEQW